MPAAIEVKNLTVTYPHRTEPAVKDVSFDVPQDAITVLIGPNGSGKTTIIRSILGLIEYQGEVKIFGQSREKARHLIGFVPQRFNFDPRFPITVAEFIGLTLSSGASLKKVRSHYIDQGLKRVGAYGLIQRRLNTLSGGQLQRVLLARALAFDPKLLILDEPESGVDVGGEQTFYDLLEELVDQKQLTALVASHELDVVYTYADRVVCVNQELLCTGKPHEVLDQETFVKLYGRGLKFYGHDHGRVKGS